MSVDYIQSSVKDFFARIDDMEIKLQNFSSDINEECQKTYFKNFDEMPKGDITKIKEKDIPKHDILCAGFPCQPFSAAGKQLGFEDTRGTLFFEICRIIKAKSPKVILLENVKNLVYHDKGNTLKVILATLESLGYFVDTKILNAADFGIPQSRERIIIVASKNKKFEELMNMIDNKPIISKINKFDDIKTSVNEPNKDFDILDINKYIKGRTKTKPKTLQGKIQVIYGEISNLTKRSNCSKSLGP